MRNTCEPLCVLAVCAWLAYGAGGEAGSHHVETAIMGSLLAASFLLSAASLCMGLRFGGRWREMPPGWRWWPLQLLEMVPTLLHGAVIVHYSRLLGRLLSTPVWAMINLIGIATSGTTALLSPVFGFATRLILISHLCAVMAYEALTVPGWSDPERGGGLRWLEYAFSAIVLLLAIWVVAYLTTASISHKARLSDLQVGGRMADRLIDDRLIANRPNDRPIDR